jgi:hypothetical protein
MTTNLGTQVPDPAAIKATEKKQHRMIRILDDADLDAVNGGEGNVHDAAVRAALLNQLNHAVIQYEYNNELNSHCQY